MTTEGVLNNKVTEAPSSEVKEKIMDVATKIFADRGYSATSTREICELARITKPTLYYYFSNKEALFESIKQTIMEDMGRGIQEDAFAGLNLRQTLEAFAIGHFLYASHFPHRVKFFIRFVIFSFDFNPEVGFDGTEGVDSCGPPPPFEKKMELMMGWFRSSQAKGEISSQLDIEDACLTLVGVLNMRVHKHLRMPEYKLTEEMAREIVQRFLKGIDYKEAA